MSDKSGRKQRSTLEWTTRGTLALAAAIAGYYATNTTLAQAGRSGDPEHAHALAPRDARITATLAQRLAIDPKSTAADRARADALARTALRQDPTAVAAVTALGIDAQARNDTAAARRFFAYAQKLSRRELVTQLWAIEDSVGRGDIGAALRQYDIALRTSPTAPDLLFPVLAAAIGDPAIRSGLTNTLAAKPAWRDGFITFVSTRGATPQATAALFTSLRRVGVPVGPVAQGAVINALIEQQQVDLAWSFYAQNHPGATRLQARDPRFVNAPTQPSPLDWNIVDAPGGSASIQRDGRRGFFDFAASASVGGPLLQQVQLLAPGTYRLRGHSTGIDQSPEALPYWSLTCRDGRELGRVIVPNSTQSNGLFEGRFTVPAGCPVQVLTLVARPSSNVSGVSGQIDRLELSPLR